MALLVQAAVVHFRLGGSIADDAVVVVVDDDAG